MYSSSYMKPVSLTAVAAAAAATAVKMPQNIVEHQSFVPLYRQLREWAMYSSSGDIVRPLLGTVDVA